MPVSPEDTANLAREVARVYSGAELSILRTLARLLERGIGDTSWERDKLDQASQVRRRAEDILDQAIRDGAEQATDAASEAARTGATAAAAEAARFSGSDRDELADRLNMDRLDRIAREAATQDRPPQRAILRTVLDAYRGIVEQTVAGVAAGADTRRQAAQRSLWKAAAQGITGFTDSSGRRWELPSYMEMALRSAVARSAVDAHTDSLAEFGHDLVIVSDAPQECELCRPYEGQVRSISGGTSGTVELPNERGGPPVRVNVAGTLDEARAGGLFHPNCRHSVSAYLPGATRQPENTTDPEGDEARQHLRYLERQVRAWKKRDAAAMSDAASTQARGKVRDYQARIREHVDTTEAKRQRPREQIGKAR